MDKIKIRQEAIKQLIRENAIEDQQTLVTLLKEQFGIETNQSIVSRDLLNLGIIKNNINGKLIYEERTIDPSREILRMAVLDIVHNEFLIIVKTISGHASFVGDYLDMQQSPEIMGTIGGENMVFVAPKSIKNIEEVYEIVCNILFFKNIEN